jgi:hypothetical protein
MKADLFNELVASVREGGAILRGEVTPTRTFVVDGLARVLLQVAAKHPDAVWDVVRPATRQKVEKAKRPGKVV